MTTEIELHGGLDLAVVAPLSELSSQIAKTEFVPSNLRNRPEAVLACMLTGQEIGIAPMQALRQIDIIDGRPALRAELMRAMVLKYGHEIWFGEGAEFTTTRVVCYGRRNGSNNVTRVEWTADMAKQANLAGKNNWKNHPRAMLAARASSEVCRLTFPDIVAGMGYSKEELEDGFTDDVIIEGADLADAPTSTKRTAAPAKNKAGRKRGPAAPASQAPIPEPALPDEDEDITDAEIVEDNVVPMTDKMNPAYVNHEGEKAAAVAESEQTLEQKQRSREVVKLAKALGVDHHPVISAITNGAADSARRLDADVAARVMDAIRAIADGRARVEKNAALDWVVVAVEAIPNDDIEDAEVLDGNEGEEYNPNEVPLPGEDDDDPEDWDSDRWRSFLSEHGVKVTQIVKAAASMTPQGSIPPGSLQSISGSGIAARLRDWVEAQG